MPLFRVRYEAVCNLWSEEVLEADNQDEAEAIAAGRLKKELDGPREGSVLKWNHDGIADGDSAEVKRVAKTLRR